MSKEKEEHTGGGGWVNWLHLLGLALGFEKIECRRENTECSISICFLLNCIYLIVYVHKNKHVSTHIGNKTTSNSINVWFNVLMYFLNN